MRPINNLQFAIYNPGGPEGIRTPGLLSAIEARSQLRYRPIIGRTVFYLSEVGMSRKQKDTVDINHSPST